MGKYLDASNEFLSCRVKENTETGEVQGVHIHVGDDFVEIMTENFPTRKWDAIRIPRSIWDEAMNKVLV